MNYGAITQLLLTSSMRIWLTTNVKKTSRVSVNFGIKNFVLKTRNLYVDW